MQETGIPPFARRIAPTLSSSLAGGLLASLLRAGAACVVAMLSFVGAPALLAQSVSFAGQLINLGSGLNYPQGTAVDANGNIFVADSANNEVKEILAVNGSVPVLNPTINVLGSGFSNPGGVAVDASGDVFVADTNNGLVKEIVAVNGKIPATGAVIKIIGGNAFVAPSSVALDGKGDLFVADILLYEVPYASGAYGSPQVMAPTYNFGPIAVAVDSSGNVYDADSNGGVFELEWQQNQYYPQGRWYNIHRLTGGFSSLQGIAIDASGNVYVTQAGLPVVEEIEAVNGSVPSNPATRAIMMGGAYATLNGVAVDKAGDLFVSDVESDRIVRLQQETAVNFGSVPVCPSAQSETGECSSTITLSYNVTASGVLGTPKVLATGQPNLDFALESGNTCLGEVTAGEACTVSVTFSPLAPGPRNGVVELVGGSGSTLAATSIYGNGTGPAIAASPGIVGATSGTFSKPWGAVADAAGNLFVADDAAATISEIPAGGGAAKTIATGLTSPLQLALDGAGNLYVGFDGTSPSIVEIPAGCATSACRKSIGTGFTSPGGVAVDSLGDVYISDFTTAKVVEVPVGCASSACQQTIVSKGIFGPHAIAIDGAGDLFISQRSPAGVVEVPAGCATSSCWKTIGGGFVGTTGVAVDAAGDVFIADALGHAAYEVTAAGVQTALSAPYQPLGIAVDALGDVFIPGWKLGPGNSLIGEVLKLQRSLPSSLSFPATPLDTTSIQSAQFQNIGNEPLVESGLTISAGWQQVAGGGTPEDCNPNFLFAPGAACNLSLSFDPTAVGAFSGSVTLQNNALNADPGIQQVSLTGTGIVAAQTITFNAIPSQVVGATLSLVATASSGLTVSFASTTPTTCTVAGTQATMLKVGTCSITASQPGDAGYSPATPVTRSFSIPK